MSLQILQFLKRRKKLIIIYVATVSIQIFLFIGFFSYDWISLISQDSLLFDFLKTSLEPYQDYRIWYQTFVDNFIYEDWLPYSFSFPNIYQIEDLLYYLWDLFIGHRQLIFIYPPFFLYIISLPGLLNLNLVFIPLLCATNLLPIITYKFLLTFFEEKVAVWGFLATTLCPLLIFYNGGLLLNTSLVTLFFMITLYLVSTDRFKSACIFLAISFLVKQVALFFILPILFYMVLRSCKDEDSRLRILYLKKLLIYSSIIIVTIFLGSLPWIIINPINYINSVFVTSGITITPIFLIPNHNSPMSWYSFFALLNFPDWFLYIVGFLNFTLIGIIVLEIIILVLLHHSYRQNKLNWLMLLDIIVYTAFLSHLFFPRGVYKYYFTLHVPLVILWLCFHFYEQITETRKNMARWLMYFLGISLLLLLIPRFYYLLFVWIITVVIIKKSMNQTRKIDITQI